jgi:hypothetical protein
MADAPDRRDFFISFNSVDLAFAEAIDTALKTEGFSTFYHPLDLPAGGNIPIWMEDALMNSAQTLALYSPDYVKDQAVYSIAERYATWWQDPGSDQRKLIPILLRPTTFTPLMAMISRIEVVGLSPKAASAHIVARLKAPKETEQRDHWRAGVALPKIFSAAYRANPNFAGRFEALESLQQSLRVGANAAITAIAGLGGVGKTTLAAEYCHRFGGRYGGVWWIRAEQEPIMLADLQALGQRLGVVEGENIEADARATLDHLASRTEPWLLVYDNAPNPDTVRKWLPSGAARCLITSRFTEFGDIAPVTRLDEWSDKVTTDYLLSRTRRDDAAGAARLAKRLGGLPLAAEQAAVYLSPRTGINFDDYSSEIARLIKQPRPPGAKGDYPDTVYAAFVKSLDALSKMERGEFALDLVRLCAFLSPDGVDLQLLKVEWGHKILPSGFVGAIADKFKREDALAALASLSLLRQDGGPLGVVLIFHRLLLEVARDWMGGDARVLWGTAAAQLVSMAFPPNAGDDTSEWPLCSRLMPHVVSLEAHAEGAALRKLAVLLQRASTYLRARGNLNGALTLAERSVVLRRLTLTEDPLHLAVALSNLGVVYRDVNRLTEAESAQREALRIQEPHADSRDPILAITLSNLGTLLLQRKDFAEAEPFCVRASKVIKETHGPDSAEYGAMLGNLDSLYDEWAQHSGDVKKRRIAARYSEQALAVTQSARGPRHPSTANRHSNLAVLKSRMEDWSAAALEMERAMAIMLSLDLWEHPFTQQGLAALADYWERSGQPERVTQLKSGDMSDLLPLIAQVEDEHRAWVAKDPETRRFGPPSPFGRSGG